VVVVLLGGRGGGLRRRYCGLAPFTSHHFSSASSNRNLISHQPVGTQPTTGPSVTCSMYPGPHQQTAIRGQGCIICGDSTAVDGGEWVCLAIVTSEFAFWRTTTRTGTLGILVGVMHAQTHPSLTALAHSRRRKKGPADKKLSSRLLSGAWVRDM
jgi:hypothetical protein